MVRIGLETPYNTVPGNKKLLSGVQKGERLFLGDLSKYGFDVNTQYNLSRVHPYEDVKVQAFLLSIPSIRHPPEIVRKSYMTYSAHWTDDFFDRSNFDSQALSQIRGNGQDLDYMIGLMGEVGGICRRMISRGKHQIGIRKGLHRMIYGGLIVGAPDIVSQRRYLEEHMTMSLADVDERVSRQIQRYVNPLAFWMTTKTVQELLLGCETQYNPTLAMLYDLLYAPALYYHDANEEEKQGELNFFDGKPTQDDSLVMIDLFSQNINSITDERFDLRVKQLRFLLQAFRSKLPKDLIERYSGMLKQFEKVT